VRISKFPKKECLLLRPKNNWALGESKRKISSQTDGSMGAKLANKKHSTPNHIRQPISRAGRASDTTNIAIAKAALALNAGKSTQRNQGKGIGAKECRASLISIPRCRNSPAQIPLPNGLSTPAKVGKGMPRFTHANPTLLKFPCPNSPAQRAFNAGKSRQRNQGKGMPRFAHANPTLLKFPCPNSPA
jgi:hypothetical protein